MERLRLRYGWGFDTSDFAVYGQDGHLREDRATNYLGYHWYRYKIRPALNDKWARSITEDKWVFYRLMDSFRLSAPRTFGLFDRTYGVTWDLARPLRTTDDLLAELDRLRPDGVVVKPNGGNQGRGVLVLDSVDPDTGRAVPRAGDVTTIEQAVDGLDVGGGTSYVVQELLRNHPVLDELAPYATNTLRVQTLFSEDGRVHVLGAVLRLGRRGTMVDNVSQGGIGVHVDVATGVTGRGFTRGHRPLLAEHPDSGAALEGRQLPCWDELLQLVQQAAGRLPGLHAVGWDVALTPAGPVIVEANNNWDLQLLQVHTDGYLADPTFRAWMTDLGAPLPSGNVLQGLVGRRLWPVLERLRQ